MGGTEKLSSIRGADEYSITVEISLGGPLLPLSADVRMFGRPELYQTELPPLTLDSRRADN